MMFGKLSAATLAVGLALGAATATAISIDLGKAIGAVSDLSKSATLSDDDVRASARQLRTYEETNVEKVAPPDNAYAQRLAALTDKYQDYDGLQLNYKVYLGSNVNADSTADGSIRVYSGIMDIVTDDELLFMIGHEIGHIKLGHSAKGMRTALAASGWSKAAGVVGGAGGLGSMLGNVVNAQHSQAQEIEADDYGMQFLKKNQLNTAAASTFLRKLGNFAGDNGTMLSSHPDPIKRAERLSQ
jgi:putative metalloprotease